MRFASMKVGKFFTQLVMCAYTNFTGERNDLPSNRLLQLRHLRRASFDAGRPVPTHGRRTRGVRRNFKTASRQCVRSRSKRRVLRCNVRLHSALHRYRMANMAMGARRRMGEDTMTGFDLYEQWRSGLFAKTGFVAISWDALEVWERVAWDELAP